MKKIMLPAEQAPISFIVSTEQIGAARKNSSPTVA